LGKERYAALLMRGSHLVYPSVCSKLTQLSIVLVLVGLHEVMHVFLVFLVALFRVLFGHCLGGFHIGIVRNMAVAGGSTL